MQTVYIHEVLERTAAYLRERGWVQGGQGHDGSGNLPTTTPACTMVAIGRVASMMGIERISMIQNVAAEALAEHLRLDYTPMDAKVPLGCWDFKLPAAMVIAEWNDDPDRTRNEVIAGILGAAAVAKAQDASIRVRVAAHPIRSMYDFAKAMSTCGTVTVTAIPKKTLVIAPDPCDAIEITMADPEKKSFKFSDLITVPTLEDYIKVAQGTPPVISSWPPPPPNVEAWDWTKLAQACTA